MRGEPKVTSAHLQRTAICYIRQSSLVQVREHTESTARQYGLAALAARLAWHAAGIEVIDCDLGLSGRSATYREGFKELVARVCMGEVGAVFGLEVSRLARSNADLARLLELARLTGTLVIDSDGVYELSDINDRLLLGLKSQMSEAELHWLTSRLNESKRAAARRGELRVPLPVGLVHDDDGAVVIDPDQEVAAAVADVFAAFTATGSAYGVAGAFAGRRFPRRAYRGGPAGAGGRGRPPPPPAAAPRRPPVAPGPPARARAAAGKVPARRPRSARAAELAAERARYDADRAERAFLACEPENRLVARSLEARWETRLTDLAEAQAALATQLSAQPDLPAPEQLAATVADLPALWSAPTTSDKDRKRLLRTLLGNVTIAPSASDPSQLAVGLRWKSGASQQLQVARRKSAIQLRCTDPAAIELACRLGPGLDNNALAAALNDAGHRTGTGQPFDGAAAGNLRSYHHIPYPALLDDAELSHPQTA